MTIGKKTALLTALGLVLALAACEEDRPTTPGPPIGNPSPSPSATPTPQATPSPEPSPSPEANRPPTVTVTTSGGCHPLPDRPCTVSVNATASDPDGDRLAYGWDGCAEGNAPLALCTVTRPGQFTATVLVADGQDHFTRATAIVEGINHAPVVVLAGRPPNPAPSNTLYSFVGQQPYDPDDDVSPNQLCTRATVTATGPCRAGLAMCGGVGDAFDWDVRTLQGPGTCVVEARVVDNWGAVGIDRFSFQVLP